MQFKYGGTNLMGSEPNVSLGVQAQPGLSGFEHQTNVYQLNERRTSSLTRMNTLPAALHLPVIII